jgi:hypothetical protein
MTDYRAYTIGRDGHLIGFDAMICANDAEAIETAKRLVDQSPIELRARLNNWLTSPGRNQIW